MNPTDIDELTPEFFVNNILKMPDGSLPVIPVVFKDGTFGDLLTAKKSGDYYKFKTFDVFLKSFLEKYPECNKLITFEVNSHGKNLEVVNNIFSSFSYDQLKKFSKYIVHCIPAEFFIRFINKGSTDILKYFIDNADDLYIALNGWKFANYIAARVDKGDTETILHLLSKGSFINERCDDGYTVLCQIINRDKSDRIRSDLVEKYFGVEMSLYETRAGVYIIQDVFRLCRASTLQVIIDRIDRNHPEFSQIINTITEQMFNRSDLAEEDRDFLVSQLLI